MTIPHLQNCPHSPYGWCLECFCALNARVAELEDAELVLFLLSVLIRRGKVTIHGAGEFIDGSPTYVTTTEPSREYKDEDGWTVVRVNISRWPPVLSDTARERLARAMRAEREKSSIQLQSLMKEMAPNAK